MNPIQIYVRKEVMLPNNDQWEHRFEIKSETSDRVYIIAQNIKKRFWACSCPAWRTHRKCKHLSAIGVPNNEQPCEITIVS